MFLSPSLDDHFGALGPADTIPGAQQRFEGLVLYAESVEQAMELANNGAAFDMTDPGGGYVLLASLANTAMITRAPTAPRSASNRMREAGTQMAMMMMMPGADELAMMIEGKADQMYQSLPEPTTLDGLEMLWLHVDEVDGYPIVP